MGTPTTSPIASSSYSHSPSSEAETDTDVSSSLDTSGSDSDFNPVRVNFGPQKTPERRFLQKVRRRDSREFHRRQTINWGLEGEGRDRVERKEGDEGEEGESEQQRAIEVVDQEDALRTENGNEEEQDEEEDPSTPDTPSRSSPLHPSTRTTPAPAYRALPSLSVQSNPPSSPAYDGDADSEGDDEEAADASYMDYTPTLEDTVDGGVDDSFDEVEQEEGAPQEDVDPTTTEPEPSSLARQLPLDEDEPSTNEELRLSSPPLPSPFDVATSTPANEPATLPSPPTTEAALEPDFDLEEATFIDEAQEDSEWEDELPSRPEEEVPEGAASEETVEGAVVDEEVLEVEVESRVVEEEPLIEEESREKQQPVELVVSIQEDVVVVQLEGSEDLEAQEGSSPGDAVVESLKDQGGLEEPSVELELEVVQVAEKPEPVEEEIIAHPSSDGSAEVEAGQEAVGELKSELVLEDVPSSLAPVPEQLIAFDVSPEKEASPEPELTPATTTIPLLTPSKPVTSFLDSSPTPFHSLPLLLPTPTPIIATTSEPDHQAEESFVSQSEESFVSQSVDLEALPADSTLITTEELFVAAALDSEAEVSMAFDASIVSSVAPEVSISPSKSETTDEDVELGRCGPSGRKSVPLVVQILTSPSELSPPPSSDSDSSTSVSLAPLGTPTPSSSTPRPISTRVAVPTPLRPTESQSSASSSTSATPPTHARRTAPTGPVEKRPAPKVLKRASPQKSAAAAEKEADRVARLRFRAQLDAAVSRTSGPSPMRSVSKPPPRPLDASTRTLGPSPRVGFVRTLARVTPSPTATSSTLTASARPVAQGRALAAPSSSATARVITPQPLHRSKPAPPSASTVRPAAKTGPLPATSVSAPAPPSSSRAVFGSRAAPPQPSSALKARPAGPPSAMKAPVSQLPKPSSSSGIPKPPSMLPKGSSARVHSSSSIGMAASSRAPVGGVSSSARPKQALKTFGSWSSAGGPTSSVRRLGGDSSMSMPVSVGGGAFARGLESESSFRMDSSFRMESPRPSRPNLGEPVRVVSPAKGANGRTIPSSMSAGPIRMNSPIKSSSSSVASSLGPSSHFNRAPRDGPFASSSTSIFAQSSSSSSFSENIKPSAPSPRKGQSFIASVEASISKAPTSLRDGKSLPALEPSSSKEPSPVNETRASASSSTSNEQASTAAPPPPPAVPAQSISSPLSEIPSSPTRSNGSSSSNQIAPPPPPATTRNASATTDASTTPGRSLRARRELEPQPPVASASRPGPPPRTASSRAKKTNSSDPPPPEEMSVAQLKSFTLMNTTKNQVYFSAMEKVVVRKDGENRPSSPGEKVKKAGKEWEATAASGAGKKRKKPLFDAGEEFSSSEEEEEEERKTHVRGPGEEEDFFSPVKQSTLKGGKGAKRSKGGAGIEEATTTTTSEASGSGSGKSKKEVKWDKGLVWIRARKNQPLELEVEGGEQEEQVGSTRGRKPKKGCMKSLDRPLDHMGNLPPPLPALTEIIKRDKVTYTQLVYDDDVQAAAPAKKGKK